MNRIKPTTQEQRLVEQYVSVLDYVSRCAQVIDGGNFHYLWDKADSLKQQADRLAKITDEVWREVKAGGTGPRADVVKAEVAYRGRHYRAGRLLHPLARDGGS